MADDELASIPKPLRDLLVNVSIEVRDDPGTEAQELDDTSELLGLYDGPTREEMLRTDSYGCLPAKVYLYQLNMEDSVTTVDALRRELRLTLRHELAHHFGFDDADLQRVWPEGA